jgi:cytosine/adenosine deaminase-related metal-dependent hydrolase
MEFPVKAVIRTVALFAIALVLPGTGEAAKLVVTNARLFTMAKGQEQPFTGYLVVAEDGTLATVAEGAPPAGVLAPGVETWDAQGKWILPGFISAHSHLWQSAYRGLASDQTLMGWIQAVYMKNAIHAQPEDFYWFTLHGALDHLRHGITGAYNFNYSASAERAELFAHEQFRAERDSGIRFVHGTNIGRISPTWTTTQARAQTESLLAWIKTQPPTPGFLSVMINGAGAFVDTPEQAKAEARLMKELGLGNETHFLESPPDQYQERAKFQWFIDAGLLGRGLLFGHFIHTDPWILRESAKAGAGMSWNPLSNGRLASGIADIPACLKAGIRIGMGVDGQASADRADPFENMRMGLYQVRARYQDATVLSPYQVLRFHTAGSADVLGVADHLGTLEPGKLADFIVLDPTDLGPVFDPYASLVFVAGTRDLVRVYVGGELKVRDGQLIGPEFAQARAELARRLKPPSPP